MSDMHIVGIVPADAEYQKKVAAYEACEAAGVPIPRELSRFFGDEKPDPAGRQIDLSRHGAVLQWGENMCEGLTIDLSKLPPEVKLLRPYMSY